MKSLLHQFLRPHLPALSRAGKAAVVAMGASLTYVAGWALTVRSGFAPVTLVGTLVACLLAAGVVTALGFRLADVRRPVVGGAYVAVLLAVYAALFAGLYGTDTVTWAVWPAAAAQLAVVYAIQQGEPLPVRG